MVTTLNAEDIRSVADWRLLMNALRDGHNRPPADIDDSFVGDAEHTMLVRSAWIAGLAGGVKAATIVPANAKRNPPLPSVHAQVLLFDPNTGQLSAVLDGTEITAWKTAADSALGSQLLSREDAQSFLMAGAGSMAEPLIRAHLTARPNLQKIVLWNRSPARVEALAERLSDLVMEIHIADSLDEAVPNADIICCATMSNTPVLKGALVSSGTHVDLVGAYKSDMREADDELHKVGNWFVDSRTTTLEHIGELKIPIAEGTITPDAVLGDLHQMVSGQRSRETESEITVFKNGGGAHLDIMVSQAILEAWSNRL